MLAGDVLYSARSRHLVSSSPLDQSPPTGVLAVEVLGAEVGDDGDARGDEGGHGLDALPRRLVLQYG